MLKNMKKLLSESMNKKRFIVSVSSLLTLTAAGTAYGAYEVTKETVTLSLDGEEQVIRTHANTVDEVLADFEIELREEDHLSHSLDAKIENNMNIVWEAAVPVHIAIGDEQEKIWTTLDTVNDLLEFKEIDINEHDVVTPNLETEIATGLEINIEKAFELTLNVGGKKQQVWSTSTTVADFLKNQNITLGKLDRVEPEVDQEIVKDSIVNVIRVEKVTDVVEEPVSYAVVTKKDDTLEKGREKIVNAGKEGKIAKHYEVILENGKEVSRELLETKTVSESINRIVAVGTKVVQQKQVSRGNDSVAKEFYVSSTAYTAYCSGCSGITSTGINLKANPNMKVIAVDPSVIPLGTKVYVEGYGYAIAGDTGSSIRGNKIDVFFPEKSQAYRWGSKKVKIKILN
ncbi:G5 and 3D domain-containing protein [Litchfieldia alkalitelluris]|uniref:G5 and 3D domain-containing protein n=1 Tax=Litchfieldia alkalitelluris TaxID=304268 RepID=UPI001F3B52AD|nr:G5 and 3D domain-containing protein [Litchfieldia alkalitelluris]